MNERLRELHSTWAQNKYIVDFDNPSEGEAERLTAWNTQIEWEMQHQPATDAEERSMKLQVAASMCDDDDDPLPGLVRSLRADIHRELNAEDHHAN